MSCSFKRKITKRSNS